MEDRELIIIGGGPAGLSAAVAARECGVSDILIIERDRELGGILQQCIHSGFGLKVFKQELTGPEYAQRFIDKCHDLGIEYMLDSIVTDITADRRVTAVSPKGVKHIQAGAVILAMGCRERTRGAINIPGSRAAGIFTAGAAQRYVNMEGYMVGRRVVILGSGDIGLIMARRLTLEGAKVLMVCEIMPYSSGLRRNIAQCLEDFGIPLKLSHTVTRIVGKERVEGVYISKVDEKLRPVAGSEEFVECDTLVLSVGLIPENELTRSVGIQIDPATGGPVVNELMETSVEGIFACGNVVQVHDLVDNVTEEAYFAGKGAAMYLRGARKSADKTAVRAGNGIRYVVPQYVTKDCGDGHRLCFRVAEPMRDAYIKIYADGSLIYSRRHEYLTPGEMETVLLTKTLKDAVLSASQVMLEAAAGDGGGDE